MTYLTILFATAGAFMLKSIYNLFFHPLRSYPGPWYWGASRLCHSYKSMCGSVNQDICSLHEKFGPVVRVAPDELSYSNSSAWQEIYGRNVRNNNDSSKSTVLFKKDPVLYGSMYLESESATNTESSFLNSLRSSLAQTSSPNFRAHLDHIYVERLDDAIEHLTSYATSKDMYTHDLRPWISNLVFDISADVNFGGHVGAFRWFPLMHPAVKSIKTLVPFIQLFVQFRRLPRCVTWTVELLAKIPRPSFSQSLSLMWKRVDDRLKDSDGHDFKDVTSVLLSAVARGRVKEEEVKIKVQVLVFATVESTSSALCGIMYCLLTNPGCLERACKEVRGCISKPSEISTKSTKEMTYLQACIMESLRIYPLAIGAFPRLVCPGGAFICGRFVPENTTVGVNNWAAYHSTQNFYEPNKFLPDRWLEPRSSEYEKDDHAAFHPFLYGPNICSGKEFALISMRLILARMLWEFDLELDPRSKDWHRQKGILISIQGPLYVKFSRRGDNTGAK